MPDSKKSVPPHRATFGPFSVDLRAGELYKGKKKIKVQQLPMQVLGALLEKPGEVVEREELKSRLWPADTFVDFEHGLNTAIKKLRQALGDSTAKPRYIETLPKKGYRFAGSVQGELEELPARRPVPSSEITGKILFVHAEQQIECVVAPVDESSREEWQRLQALGDDVGVSMMIAHNRLLLLEVGKPVRVLSANGQGWCETRVLEGEHYGKTALLPRSALRDSAK